MSAPAPGGDGTRAGLATARPYLLGGVASLSVGAAAIHFAVIFEHFAEYTLYGVFFLVVAWAQMIWAAVVLWRPSRLWLSLGIAGNALVLAVYVASRAVGLPVGPDAGHPEPFGGLDGVSAFLEFALIAWSAALWWRPSLADRPVRRGGARGGVIGVAGHAWHGVDLASPGHEGVRLHHAPTAAQVIAAGRLIKETGASLARYRSVQAALAAGYTYVLRVNGEEHLLYDGGDPSYTGLDPRHPSSLVYATDVPDHAPILLGAMYIENRNASGPQVGGSLTRWHAHLVVCDGGKPTIAGFGVQLRGSCNPATWHDRYTAQMLHVWIVPHPGGPFSDDLSLAATNAAVRAVLGRK